MNRSLFFFGFINLRPLSSHRSPIFPKKISTLFCKRKENEQKGKKRKAISVGIAFLFFPFCFLFSTGVTRRAKIARCGLDILYAPLRNHRIGNLHKTADICALDVVHIAVLLGAVFDAHLVNVLHNRVQLLIDLLA